MPSLVLDASAVLALLRDEPGADKVEASLPTAIISAVNLQEVWKELLSSGVPAKVATEIVDELRLEVRAHGQEDAWTAATLADATKTAGSGLGDRSCMALAISAGIPALTADRSWAKVKAKGLRVELVR